MSDAIYARSGMSGLRMDFVGFWVFESVYNENIMASRTNNKVFSFIHIHNLNSSISSCSIRQSL